MRVAAVYELVEGDIQCVEGCTDWTVVEYVQPLPGTE